MLRTYEVPAGYGSQVESLLKTGQKDMELVATLCEQAGIDAPMLRHSITALQSQVDGALMANVTTLMQHLSTKS